MLLDLHGKRLAHPSPHASEGLVPGDRREPRPCVPRLRPVQERPLGGEKRLLYGVFRLHPISQERAADRAYEPGVALVELLDMRRDRGIAVGVGSRLIGEAAHRRDAGDSVIHGTATRGRRNIPHGCELPELVAGAAAGANVTTLTCGGNVTTRAVGETAAAPPLAEA